MMTGTNEAAIEGWIPAEVILPITDVLSCSEGPSEVGDWGVAVSASVLEGVVAPFSEDSRAGKVPGKVEVKTMTVSGALDKDELATVSFCVVEGTLPDLELMMGSDLGGDDSSCVKVEPGREALSAVVPCRNLVVAFVEALGW